MLFRYVACDAQGTSTRGVIEGESEAQAESRLWEAGLIIIELRPLQKSRPLVLLQPTAWASILQPVTRRHIEALWDELAHLLQPQVASPADGAAAVPMVSLPLALHLLAERADSLAYCSLLASLAESTAAGQPLSDALESSTSAAGPLELRLLRAGEQAGDVASAIERLAILSRLDREALDPIRKALTRSWLALLLVLSMAGLAAWLFQPSLEETVNRGAGNWASGTVVQMVQWVQGGLQWMQGRLWWALPVLAAMLLGLVVLARTPLGRSTCSACIWQAPLAGPAVRSAELARVCRWLQALLDRGVPWPDFLDLLPHATSNIRLQEALMQVRSDVLDGIPLDQAARSQHLLPLSFSRVFSPKFGPYVPAGSPAVLIPLPDTPAESGGPADPLPAVPAGIGWLPVLESHYRRRTEEATCRIVQASRWLTRILIGSISLWLVLGLAPAWRAILNSWV